MGSVRINANKVGSQRSIKGLNCIKLWNLLRSHAINKAAKILLILQNTQVMV